MPTMPERMAGLEADVRTVKDDVTEVKGDVKILLTWQAEERGAKAQRSLTLKQFGVAITALTFVINLMFKVVA